MSGRATRDRRASDIPALRDFARGAPGVERLARLDPRMSLEEATALHERDWMCRRDVKSFDGRALRSEQAVTHRDERVADGPQIGMRCERVPSRLHSSNRRVFYGNHAGIRVPFVDCANRAGKGCDRHSFHGVSPDLRDRALGVGAAVALKCDAHCVGRRPRFT